MVKLVEPPLQIVAVPLITPVGRAFTDTVAVPLKSAAIDVHLESLNEAIVYVVETLGDTLTVIGLVAPLNDVPSLNVPLHGPTPFNVNVMFAAPPLQIVGVPLITPVGRGLTVTVADPVLSPATEAQLASVKVAMV